MIRYVRMADPKLLTPGRFPTLDALCDRCEALSGFQASWPPNSFLPTDAR
jgi:glutathione S-transferase